MCRGERWLSSGVVVYRCVDGAVEPIGDWVHRRSIAFGSVSRRQLQIDESVFGTEFLRTTDMTNNSSSMRCKKPMSVWLLWRRDVYARRSQEATFARPLSNCWGQAGTF